MTTTERNAPPPNIQRASTPLKIGPNQVRVLAGVDTGEPIGAVEYAIAPGFAPPPLLHRHTTEDAGWFVIDGAIEFSFEDGTVVVAEPGDSVTHPRGCWFRWANASEEESATAICWFAPAGFERIFAEIAEASRDHLDAGGTVADFLPTLLEIRARFGDEVHRGGSS